MNLFLTKDQIANALGTTPGVAAALLAGKGVKPVDWGRGRGRGIRWYAPAVEQAAREMHEEAQEKQQPLKAKRKPRQACGLIAGRSFQEVYQELTGSGSLQ